MISQPQRIRPVTRTTIRFGKRLVVRNIAVGEIFTGRAWRCGIIFRKIRPAMSGRGADENSGGRAPERLANLGSARVSGAGDRVSRSRTLNKVVSARRRNQHARRVRYPAV